MLHTSHGLSPKDAKDLEIISDRNRLEFFLSELEIKEISGYNVVFGNARSRSKLARRGILEVKSIQTRGVFNHVLSPYGVQLYQTLRR